MMVDVRMKSREANNSYRKAYSITGPEQAHFTDGFCAMAMCWGTMDVPWQQSGQVPNEAHPPPSPFPWV